VAETPRGPTGIAVTEAILDTVRRAADEADVEPTAIRAAGIGSIGPLDLAEGIIDNPANLPDTIDRIPLTGPVSKLIDSDDVYLHNDTTAGVIGERFFSDRNPDDMVYLTISSGIGAGVCVDGNVLTGWDGNAGEVGHMQLDPTGFMPCGCGWKATGRRTVRATTSPLRDATPPRRPRGDIAPRSGRREFGAADVFAHAEEGDEFADFVLEQVNHWNAMGVANLVHAYAPLVVYVGGAVADQQPDQILRTDPGAHSRHDPRQHPGRPVDEPR